MVFVHEKVDKLDNVEVKESFSADIFRILWILLRIMRMLVEQKKGKQFYRFRF